MAESLVDGTLDGWPVSLEFLEHFEGSGIYGGHCAPYTQEDDTASPDAVMEKCHQITDATDGMTKRRSILAKAKAMGFVEDGK